MSCNQNQLPRPVRGNAFNIAVKVVARRLDGTVIDDFELSSEDVLNIVYRGTLTPTAFTIEDNNVAMIHFDGTQAVGMYGVDFSGVWEGEQWRFALPIIFQVVDQTSQGWLPKDGIIVDPTYEVVASVTFATVGGTTSVQADWDETNPADPSYIKNKPTVYTQQQTDAMVAQERQARQQADTTLDGKITANTNALAAEKSRAEAAEQGLQTAIGTEETRAKGVEQGLLTAIGAEETRARGAEQGLQTAIGAEETRAKAAEKQNADDIDNIEAVIPAQASAQNQLADKNFVNSSISTNTANFVGTYNSLAELQAVQNPTNNDYGFVIEQDAAGNEYYDRYKYVASSQQWLFEYKVESTPFTASQWAAIQSGITSALVTKLSALPTNAEIQQALTLINTTLAGKANSADIPTALSQLSQDATHRLVTDTEKTEWNNKEDKFLIEAPVNATDATLPVTTLACEVGKYYRLGVAVETLAVTLPEMSDGSTLRGCVIYMTIGTTPAITFTGTAHGGVTPPVYCQDGFELKSGETYEVNCVYNGGAWVLAAVAIDTTDITPTGGGE